MLYPRVLFSLFALTLSLAGCQSISKLNRLKFDAEARDRVDAGSPPAAAGPDASLPQDAGTDASDCVIEDGNQCEPLRQCGCDENNHCLVVGESQRAQCRPFGSRAAWSACSGALQCPAGQTCDRGSCRPYCEHDVDCPDGECVALLGPDNTLSDQYRVCWMRCEAETESSVCAEGTSCRPVKTPSGDIDFFCAAPADPCPSVEDGVCDEPSGTGACAEGTDARDCCERPDGWLCDPVAQCGCANDFACFHDTAPDSKPSCVPVKTGKARRGESCDLFEDCQPGLLCNVGFGMACYQYCRDNADCGNGGICTSFEGEVGFCLNLCSRDDPEPNCAEGLVCAHFLGQAFDLCWEQPPSCEEYRRNGTCEESEDVCAKGTDPEDCCVPPTAASTCNPFAPCGCEQQPGTYCRVGEDGNFSCSPGGAMALGEACATQADCAQTGVCDNKLCRAMCNTFAQDCEAETPCLAPTVELGPSEDSPRYGVCADSCDVELNDCTGEEQCINLPDTKGFCSTASSPCPYIGDEICDDTRPGGTRLCKLGTDPDCEPQ